MLLTRSLLISLFALLFTFSARAEPLAVRHPQPAEHGLLILRSEAGKVLATGDLISSRKGFEVHSRLTLHFLDGSLDDEDTVYSDDRVFRLVRDHHIQRGRSYPNPIETTIDMAAKTVTTRLGTAAPKTEHMDLPPDLYNGFLAVIVLNFPPGAASSRVSYLAEGAKPRIVGLEIHPDGEDHFLLAGVRRKAERYKIHTSIGGISGVLAPLVGKQPPDFGFWSLPGDPPAFLRFAGQLYVQGPMWTLSYAAPTWPADQTGRR